MSLGDANAFFAEFESLLSAEQLEHILAAHAPLARRPPKLRSAELLVGLVYHVSQPQGTLAAHLEDLTGCSISDSAASQRRLAMPWAIFEAVLEGALAPLADPLLQPEAFYAGLRLVGIDGTPFSLSNTPAVLGTMTKAQCREVIQSAAGDVSYCQSPLCCACWFILGQLLTG